MNTKSLSVLLGLLPIVTVISLIIGFLPASGAVLVLGIALPSLISTFIYIKHKRLQQVEI